MSVGQYTTIFTNPRVAVMLLLGFSSGLPLALTTGTLQAWATAEGTYYRYAKLMRLPRIWVLMSSRCVKWKAAWPLMTPVLMQVKTTKTMVM